jgi:hypothetical protein
MAGWLKNVGWLADLLKPEADKQAPQLDCKEPWAAALLNEIESIAGPDGETWLALLAHAAQCRGSVPSKAYLKRAATIVESVDGSTLASRLASWFGYAAQLSPRDQQPFGERNSDILKGLVWTSTLFDSAIVAPAIGTLGLYCFAKLPNIGARSHKVGNACVSALSHLGEAGVVQLTRMRSKVRYATASRLLDRALEAAAAARGIAREELEEIVVPEFGLDAEGKLTKSFGEYGADVIVVGARGVELRWFTSEGKALSGVPARVKSDHAEALKTLQKTVKEARQQLDTNARRLEDAFLLGRVWTFGKWRQRFVNHPLLGALGQRVIWQLRCQDGPRLAIWRDGELVDAAGSASVKVDDATEVRLWHPIGFAGDEIRAWRRYVSTAGVTQPFKQAHREVYILTDAELDTHSYSNRFAGHFLRQHQFSALCRERGWTYTLQGQWDSYNVPHRVVPGHGIRAEFFLNGADQNAVSPSGVSLYVSTDRVRFYSPEAGGPMPLSEVPALVFSEVMRDVDLFVGVCSVGNDPNWSDSGETDAFGHYWHQFSVGRLTETAETRREVICDLLPKLAFGNRCELDDRFLRVRGDLGTYRIHLASGNILREQNNQYLCIVEAPQATSRSAAFKSPMLPFEGDHLLALILSKAALLADDAKIVDPSIRRQILRD